MFLIKRFLDVYEAEPAVVVGLADAAIVLAVALGAPIDSGVKVALDTLLIAVSAFLVRSKVTPTASLPPTP